MIIKCLLGLHDWDYSTWDEQTKWVELNSLNDKVKQLIEIGDCQYPMRFCLKCYKKESRRRRDMHIYWVRTNTYSIKELRFIRLNKIIRD
jgi:hypothetical protein